MALNDEQKEDLQFWFYSQIFLEGKEPHWALKKASTQAEVSETDALAYLENDGRVVQKDGRLDLVSYEIDSDDPQGIYVDIEWMTNLLRPKIQGEKLHRALGVIFKLSPKTAAWEESQIPQEEGED